MLSSQPPLEGLAFGQGATLTAFASSFSIIIANELGDETFIIAALMAMRNPKRIVLAAALSALWLMTILSTCLGLLVPTLLSKQHTHKLATVLYTFFGIRLLYMAWEADDKVAKEEMKEVEEKLAGVRKDKGPEGEKKRTGLRGLATYFFHPIFLQTFMLTFVGEWGDKSQIATIAMAAEKDPLGVTLGGCMGHLVCTTLAVVGGQLLAMKISPRTVAFAGGCLFLLFAVDSAFDPFGRH